MRDLLSFLLGGSLGPWQGALAVGVSLRDSTCLGSEQGCAVDVSVGSGAGEGWEVVSPDLGDGFEAGGEFD